MKRSSLKAGFPDFDRYSIKRQNNPVLCDPGSAIASIALVISQSIIAVAPGMAGAAAHVLAMQILSAPFMIAGSMGLNMLASGLVSPKAVQTSLSRSPHLINTHDTDEVVMPSYGEFRKGCNWIFAEESGGHNKYLNLVLTWAEGLCNGLIYTTQYKSNFTGAGKNDMRIRGTFSGSATRQFKVQIDGTGSPNTFKWSVDDGVNWVETTVAMSANWYTLQEGVQIKFASTIDHTSANSWTWMAGFGLWVGESLLGLFEDFGPDSKDLADHYWYNGSKTQTVDTALKAQCPLYDDANRRTCYSYLRLKYNLQAFPSGVQDFFALARWRHLFDPREPAHVVTDETTWAWSNTAVLVALDWAIRRFGMHRDYTRIDEDALIDTANWCDVNSKVTNGGSTYQCIYDHTSGATTEPGVGADWRTYWRLSSGGVVAWVTATVYSAAMVFNGAILDEQSPEDTLRDIELCYRGFHFERDGKLVFRYFADDSPVMTFLEEDVQIDPETFKISIPGIPETPDRVVAWYQEPLENYASKPTFYPDDAGLANEAALNEMELNLIGVTSRQKAKQLSKFHYLRAVYNKTYSLILSPRSYALEPGDMITITHSFPGWNATKVRIVSPGVSQDNGWFRFSIIEENSAIYNTDVNMANEDITIVPGVYTYPPDISVGSVTAKGDGFSVKITKPSDAVISGYIIYVFTADTVASSVVIKRISGTPSTATIDLGTISETGGITLTAGIPYFFWATALDENEHESLNKFYLGTATSGASVVDNTTVPNAPTAVTLTLDAQKKKGRVYQVKTTLAWTAPTNVLLSGYEIEMYAEINGGGALQKTFTAGKNATSAKWTDDEPDQAYSSRIRAISKWQITGTWSAWANASAVTFPSALPTPTIGDLKANGKKITATLGAISEVTYPEFAGFRVYASKVTGFTPAAGNLVSEGKSLTHTFQRAANSGGTLEEIAIADTIYVRASAIDVALQETVKCAESSVVAGEAAPNAPTSPILSLAVTLHKGAIYKVKATGSWTAPTNVELSGYDIEIYNAADGGGTLQKTLTEGKSATTCKWTDNDPDTAYSMRARAISRWDRVGAWSAWANASAINDTAAPAAPTLVSITAKGGKVVCRYTQNSEIDAKQYWVYIYTSNSPTSAGVIAREAHPKKKITIEVGTVSETLPGGGTITLTAGTLYHFWQTCVDEQGNESTKSYYGSVTVVKGLKKNASNQIVDEDDTVATADNINDGATHQLAGGVLGYTHLDASGLVEAAKVYKTEARYTVPSSYFLDLRGWGTQTGTWNVTADWLTAHDASSPPRTASITNFSKSINLDLAGPAVNGRDQAGAFSNQWVYIYALLNTTLNINCGVASTNGTTPTLTGNLSAYDYFVRIGAVYYSNHVETTHQLGYQSWTDLALVFEDSGPAVANTAESVSIARQVPPTALAAFGFFGGTAAGTGQSGMSVSPRSDMYPQIFGSWNRTAPVAGYDCFNSIFFWVPIIDSTLFYWKASRTDAEFGLWIVGWTDDI